MSGEKAKAKKMAVGEAPDVGRTGAAPTSAPASGPEASGAPESAKKSAKAGSASARESTTREDAGADKEAAKERFRDALERKNAAAHRSSTAARNTGSVHGSEVSGGGARMFRRKSG